MVWLEGAGSAPSPPAALHAGQRATAVVLPETCCFWVIIAFELDSKGRYIMASIGSPMVAIVQLGAVLDTVPPIDRSPSHLSRASGDHGVTGKLGRTCLLLACGG